MFFQTEKKSYQVICDIGSSSVALALVEKSDKPTVAVCLRTRLGGKGGVSLQNRQVEIVKTLDGALKSFATSVHEFKKNNSIHISRGHIVFSSPWYVSKTVSQNLHKDTPFVFDSHSLTDVVEIEEKKFEQEVVQNAHQRFLGGGIRMIEREVMKIMLNGYETTHPYLQSATDVALRLYMGIVSHDYLAQIDVLLRNHLHLKTIEAHTFPLVSYKSIIKLFPHEKDLILVDFGGESTDVAFLQDGVITASESFPYGRSHIVGNISQSLNVPHDVAESYLGMLHDGSLNADTRTSLEAILSKSIQFWSTRWAEISNTASPHGLKGKNVFITVKDDISQIVIRAIEDTTKAKVFISSKQSTESHVSFHPKISYDVSIAMSAITL